MEEKICDAIENDDYLLFEYDGAHREVIPYKLGKTTDGNTILESVQIAGESQSGDMPYWRFFELSQISNFNVSKESSVSAVAGSDKILPDTERKYKEDDYRFEETICSKDEEI